MEQLKFEFLNYTFLGSNLFHIILLFGFTNFLEFPMLEKDRKSQMNLNRMTNVFLGIIFLTNLLKFINFNFYLKTQTIEDRNEREHLKGINFVIFSF